MRKIALIILVGMLGIAPAARAEDYVGVLRVASLDALVADVQHVAAAVGKSLTREEIVQSTLEPLGFDAGEWIDGNKPIVVVLPIAGLMAGADKAWIAALPVEDVDETLGALGRTLADPEVDGDLHSFIAHNGARLFMLPDAGYLRVAMTENAVRSFDLDAALEVVSLPPGNVTLDIHLEPVAPMLQMGLAAGRQMVVQQLENEDTGDPSAADAVDPASMVDLIDLYLQVLNDVINNTSRLQFALEVASSDMVFHKRLVPRADSTLAGLIAAQKGGLPAMASRLDAGSMTAAMAGRINYTPEFREALLDFVQRYFRSIGSLADAMPEESSDFFRLLMEQYGPLMENWMDCSRGDFAATFDIGETGIRMVQVAGVTDGDKCEGMLEDVAKAVEAVPGPEDEPVMTVTRRAFVHNGVGAMRLDTTMFHGTTDPDELEIIERMLGGDSYSYFMGMSGDHMLASAGAGAEELFKKTVDGLTTRRKRGAGITPRTFEPVKVGPGFFAVVDVKRMVLGFSALVPEDDDMNEAVALFAGVPDEAARMVFGARFADGVVDIDMTMALELFKAFAEAEEEEETPDAIGDESQGT